jgi:hypothetical protein
MNAIITLHDVPAQNRHLNTPVQPYSSSVIVESATLFIRKATVPRTAARTGNPHAISLFSNTIANGSFRK